MPARPTYEVEGEHLTFSEIRARVPATIKSSTLKARLVWYGRATWEALSEPPTHRPRPHMRAKRQVDHTRPAMPAWPHYYELGA